MATLLATAVAAISLAACGLEGVGGGESHGSASGPVAPPITEVEPLQDVRDWTGAASAVLPDVPVDPSGTRRPDCP